MKVGDGGGGGGVNEDVGGVFHRDAGKRENNSRDRMDNDSMEYKPWSLLMEDAKAITSDCNSDPFESLTWDG